MAMGLQQDFFDNYNPDRNKFIDKESFPDLNATWERATWPTSNFEVDFRRYEGKVW